MKLRDIVQKLDLKVRTGADRLDVEVTEGYVSDMLSDVMGHAPEGALWVTLQTHQNIVAVAVMKTLAGIVLIKGREPDQSTLDKAVAEGVAILTTDLSAFALVARLHDLGITGN